MSALPVLADNLLRIELETQEVPAQIRMWSTGIRDVDKGISGTVWTGGKVTGVASEKGSSVRLVLPDAENDAADNAAAQ